MIKKRKDRIDRRWKNNCGYIEIYRPDHPFSDKKGCLKEHRFIIEQYLGRYLKKKEIVHHINGIRDDNRIKNLKVFSSNNEHAKLPNTGQFNSFSIVKYRWKKSHKVERICKTCKKKFQLFLSVSNRWKNSGTYCSRKCRWSK